MRRVVIVCCFVALCAGVVLAGASIASPQAERNPQVASAPMAQAETGAGFLVEFSTLGLLGVGAASLFVCRKRKRL